MAASECMILFYGLSKHTIPNLDAYRDWSPNISIKLAGKDI